jgi:hypothetical protein
MIILLMTFRYGHILRRFSTEYRNKRRLNDRVKTLTYGKTKSLRSQEKLALQAIGSHHPRKTLPLTHNGNPPILLSLKSEFYH